VYGGKRLKPLDGKPDLRRRVGIAAWHPSENIIACANQNCIYFFNEERKKKKI
jgi:hypothetical protein